MDSDPAPARGRMGELVRYFLRLGLLGFGGPVALVGQMERELVNEKGWMTKEQMREAKHAYRLDGDNIELDRLVGKQVSVEGTIADSSDLAKRSEEMRKDNKPADLDASDLAKVDVKTIAAVSDVCSDKR